MSSALDLSIFDQNVTYSLGMAEDTLPYWLVNVPKDQWPKECPEFLKTIGPRDRQMISTPISQFHRSTWSEVQHNIGAKSSNPYCVSILTL